jgi:hypothetical protein
MECSCLLLRQLDADIQKERFDVPQKLIDHSRRGHLPHQFVQFTLFRREYVQNADTE